MNEYRLKSSDSKVCQMYTDLPFRFRDGKGNLNNTDAKLAPQKLAPNLLFFSLNGSVRLTWEKAKLSEIKIETEAGSFVCLLILIMIMKGVTSPSTRATTLPRHVIAVATVPEQEGMDCNLDNR